MSTPLVPPLGHPQRYRTYTSNSTSNNESSRIPRNSADQTPDLKDEDGAEEGRLDVEALVDVAKHGLERRSGEEVR